MNQNQYTDPEISRNRGALLPLLAISFYCGIPFVVLTAKEIIDKNYDGGGLGFLIIFLFIFPPFVIFSVLSLIKIREIKSAGEKIGNKQML